MPGFRAAPTSLYGATHRGRICIFVAIFPLLFAACASIPGNSVALDAVSIHGNHAVSDKQIKQKIASTESPRFLGMFEGVIYDYSVFDRYVLERDLSRVERYYQARGFYRARARAARVTMDGRHARVQIVVEEGPPVIIRRVDIHGLEALPAPIAERARAAVSREIAVGYRLAEEPFIAAENALRSALNDEGYAYAMTQRAADVNMPANAASVGFWLTPGPRARFGEVRIEGLGELPEKPIRRTINIKPGEPYSGADLDSARQALLELGVFSSVVIEPVLQKPPPTAGSPVVPIRVRVEPSKLRAVHVGIGMELDTLKTDIHLNSGWETRNFFGGLRRFTVELIPGVVLYPTRLPSLARPDHLLPEVKLRTQFRQPSLFEARTAGFIRGEGSIFPVLLSSNPDPAAGVLGYHELRAGVGADRSFGRVYVALSHNFQVNSPFTYVGALDPDLHLILVSYPELFNTVDFRDDRIHPHVGIYLSNDLQIAGVGGDAHDVKFQPEFRGYIPVIDDITIAARATVGLLFPSNYGSTIESDADTGTPGSASRAAWIRDIQLMFLRGFFSGGSGSNRGYAMREIGPHGAVPFFNPGQTSTSTTLCATGSPDNANSSCDLPLGGFTLWEGSLELRYPISGPLTGVVFSDASDVSPRRADFRWNHPHLSLGVGVRYDTPVGPIRADAGYRVPNMQAPATPDEGHPRDTFGLPLAISFGIGEAF